MTTPASSVPLVVENCTKQYGTGTLALAGVDLVIDPGELVALLGPNGSGKSTLVHGVVGLHEIDAKALAISGYGIHEPASRRSLGFVPDELPIPLSLTGHEYLDHLAGLRGRCDPVWQGVLVAQLDLEPHLGKFIADMSHGTKKKLQLVAAVQHVPDLLVLDEPFRGLDPRSSVVIRCVIEALRERGTAVLVATHDVLAAEHWFDRVVLLHEGVVVADGAPRDLVARSGAEDLETMLLRATDAPGSDDVRRLLTNTLLDGTSR